ncbi:MAG: hypothetical protein JXN65_04040 [Clostridia bacterium]|nr:hypothetical protein [Clostridia bacterium]
MKLHKILPHINLALSITMLTVIVVNSINPMMTFLVGNEFETLLIVLVGIGIISSSAAIWHNAKCNKK